MTLDENINLSTSAVVSPDTQTLVTTAGSDAPSLKNKSNSMLKFVVKTSKTEKECFDEQCSKFVFATNSSFRTVDHPEFVKFCQLLRPGYKPPDRQAVGDKWLNKIHSDLEEKSAVTLKHQPVCMSFDGWSNVRNEPIVSASITTDKGDVLITDSVDTRVSRTRH